MENDLKREDLIRRSDVIAKLKEENERGHLAPWVGKDVYSAVRRIPAVDVRENVIRTQGDKLRAASEDEIIQWYCRHRNCGTCDYGHDVECSIRAWLKQEVDDGDPDT